MHNNRRPIWAGLCAGLILVSFDSSLALTAGQARRVGQFYAKQDAFSGNVVVFRDGKVISNESYGLANVEWKIPVSARTRFAVGSVTKQFTAAAILLLQEQGLLHTTDKLSLYYPDTPAAWKEVTLQELLRHTSGIPDALRISGTAGFDQSRHSPQEVVREAAAKPLRFSPGSHTEYNNTGYLLLGLIVEKVSGQTYAEFLQKHIFSPLNMHDTGVGFTSEIIPNKAYGYFPSSPIQTADPLPYTTMFSAGAIYSSGADLAKWLIALHGGHVLKPESYAEMTSADADGFGYGLEVSVQSGQKDIRHDGQVPGYISDTEYFPAMKTGIINLTNQAEDSFTPGTHAVTYDLANLVRDEHAIVRALGGEVNVSLETLQRYIGTYRSSDATDTETMRIDVTGHHLRMTIDKREFTYMAEAPTRFYAKDWDSEIDFHKDDRGTILIDAYNFRNETMTSWRKVP